MSEKGIVKWLLIAIVFICLLQFIYYIPTNKVERQAEEYAQEQGIGITDENSKSAAIKAGRIHFLDSVSSLKIFSIPLIKEYTYADLKKQQLALGLDLKGGMSTILQIDLSELLVSLSGNSTDPAFKAALSKATERMKSSQSDYISLFVEEFQKESGGKKLASIFSRGASIKDRIKFETPDIDVARILREIANETVDLTFKRLKDRIDKLGVTQPNVSLDKARDMIIVELPGIDNPERARKYLQASAKLEFWEIYRNIDPGVYEAIVNVDKKLKALEKGDTSSVAKDEYKLKDKIEYKRDSLGNVLDSSIVGTDTIRQQDTPLDRGPLLRIFTPASSAAGGYAILGTVEKANRKRFLELVNMPEVKPFLPIDLEFKIDAKPFKLPNEAQASTAYSVYAIKKKPGSSNAPLDGERIVRASANPDNLTGEVVVSLAMDNKGAKAWGELTTRAANDNKREIAILLDDEVVSCPSVREPILGGSSQISGNFTIDEAKDLANILQVGKLPAKTKIVQESLVGPSLGKENISKSLWSTLGGFFLVLLFMVVYYTGGGFVSIIAMFLNVLFILATLASFGTVLTLPGIAGLVLTMGIAVDANVIIYERIKEELAAGRSYLESIKHGYLNSYSAIIDSHVTNLLTCVVLFIYGLGPIKGFAIVLIIGIIFSLFTSVLVSRLIVDWWTGKGKTMGFSSEFTAHAFKNINVDWVGFRKYAYIFSLILITISFVSFFTRGFELGVEFKGGYSYNVSFDRAVDADVLRNTLTKTFEGNPVVKSVDTKNTFNITTSYMINESGDDAVLKVNQKLFEGIKEVLGNDLTYEQFMNHDTKGTHVVSFSQVGPVIADDIKSSAYKSIIIALFVIFIYIFFRFYKWQYSLGAIVALFHDTIVVLGAFSLFHGILPFSMEVDQTLIAAVLTVIGYSMNDTVIVFDRIKEFLSMDSQKTDRELVNEAINTTLSRTINTSLATILTIIILFFFGGASTKGFCFAIIVGIIIGTFSSICVAMPVVIDFTKNLRYAAKKVTSKVTKQVAKV
ncbi:MAG: protein translocase subunit SecDF [Saprospiraceae bacterium]|nr:protein translocase subunit SecDF [Saprospiraceae bacterium]